MRPELWWYVARATGLVAWALAVASILWGLALSTRAGGKRPKAPWLLDLPRHLGGLTMAAVALHLVALVADSFATFDLVDLLVPFASGWRPGPVAWGVVAFWLLLAVEVTSLLGRRVPKKWWRRVHLTSYVVAVTATVHGLTAGADAGNPVVLGAVVVATAAIAFFTAYRFLAPKRAAASARAARSPVPTSV